MNKKEYFTRVPNDYIQSDIKTKYGVSRKFYITYILIDRYRSYEDFSWITIRKVLEFYGYKTTKHKPKAFHEILDVLEYMVNNKMIKIKQDLDSIGYDTGIEIKIIPENFDSIDNFARITSSQLDFIMMNDSTLSNENILIAFLYISSYIFIRKRNDDGTERQGCDKNPEAFWKRLDFMAKDLSMSKDTLNECVKYLTSPKDGIPPLLIKREIGSIKVDPDKPPKNIPNIYVFNKEGYEQEIKWAFQKIIDFYKADEFGEVKRNNKKQK